VENGHFFFSCFDSVLYSIKFNSVIYTLNFTNISLLYAIYLQVLIAIRMWI
jgi:hypothetical protein